MSDELGGVGPFDVEPGRAPEPPEREPAERPEHDAGDVGAELPPPVAPADELAGLLPEVSEQQVRDLLVAQGAALHSLAAVEKSSDEWVYLQAELDAIVPPLTRIVNRYDVLRRAAAMGDYPALAFAFGGYTARSLRERAAVLAAREAGEPAPSDVGQAEWTYAGPAPPGGPA